MAKDNKSRFNIDKFFSLVDKQGKKAKAKKAMKSEEKHQKKRKYVSVDSFTGKRLYATKKPVVIEVNL